MADNYPLPPAMPLNTGDTTDKTEKVEVVKTETSLGKFPDKSSSIRLGEYDYYRKLFMGNHFEAFNIRIDSELYSREYQKLRHIVVNFAGLLSKICADMLFSEPPTIKVPKGDQEWVDGFWRENNMDVQCYESALSNSYNGDALFKLRIDKRNPNEEEMSVIAEDVTPRIYFPKLNGFNVRQKPNPEVLAWTYKYDGKDYLRQEIHTPGKIENKAYEMQGENMVAAVSLVEAGLPDLKESVETLVDDSLLFHIPNWKTGDRYWGISDYHDLQTLFYALNNRLSKIDNILDKHGDPILMIPPGVLDDNGKVNRSKMGVIEVKEGENNKPEYIVWDASLESAFTEVEKLVDMLYLVAEISPDLLGLGEGNSDSGRALKFKLMRTLAKTARKRLYYDRAIKEMVYRAQQLAKAHSIKVNGKTLAGEPVMPEIDWKDGLPIDNHEQLLDEVQAVDAGLTSKKDAIMRLYGVDEKTAEEVMKTAEEEQPKVEMPTSGVSNGANPFNKKTDTNPSAK